MRLKNFLIVVDDDAEMNPNEEIDSFAWFSPEEARKNIKPGSLAGQFLNEYLNG